MNPESDPALRQHAVLLYDEDVAEVILGFEDLPRTWGDNDFNDWVIRERLRTVYDANGLVSGCILDGFIAARGAANSNGFALRLVDIEGAQIESATLNINGNSYQKSVENNQTDAVVSLWSNSQTYTKTGETGKCSLFNTNKQCAQFDPVPFSFDVKFTNSQLSLNHSALDFFIYRTSDRTLEIHMPEYAQLTGSILQGLVQKTIRLIQVNNAISNQQTICRGL